jgi:hypothetical protein
MLAAARSCYGQGDGSALSGSQGNLPQGILADFNGDNPLQIANAYASLYDTGLPDLPAISGDPANGYYLDYYYAVGTAPYFQAFAVNTVTPCGTARAPYTCGRGCLVTTTATSRKPLA